MPKKSIYLDYASTTPLDKSILKTMLPYMSLKFGNSSSQHEKGLETQDALEKARKIVAKAINAEPEEIIFTSSATESNNLALLGLALAKGKGHILISAIEHDSVIKPAKFLKEQGFNVELIPVDKFGQISPIKVKEIIKKNTILVSVMHANNEIGTIEPIAKIGKICKDQGVLFHTDASQTLGKLKIDVKKMNIDFLTGSAHKIYGPKGVGFLYIRKGVKIEPLFHGGGQEFGLRSGTSNVAGIVGLAKALNLAQRVHGDEIKIRKMRDELISGVLNKIPNSYLTGHPKKRLYNNASFRFDFVEGESIVEMLNQAGIYASTASACASKTLEPSHVLLALGLKSHQAHGSLRLTLGRQTKEEDIEYVLKVLPKIIKKLRRLSPYGKK